MSENFEPKPEQELTIEEQVELAREFLRATSDRNQLTEQYPDFDDLAVFVDGSPSNRELYEELERVASKAVSEFDEKVKDKDILVKHLREIGENGLADIIERREKNLKKFRR